MWVNYPKHPNTSSPSTCAYCFASNHLNDHDPFSKKHRENTKPSKAARSKLEGLGSQWNSIPRIDDVVRDFWNPAQTRRGLEIVSAIQFFSLSLSPSFTKFSLYPSNPFLSLPFRNATPAHNTIPKPKLKHIPSCPLSHYFSHSLT